MTVPVYGGVCPEYAQLVKKEGEAVLFRIGKSYVWFTRKGKKLVEVYGLRYVTALV